MPATLRPRSVDELIMDGLLGVVDDALKVFRGVIDEFSKSDRVIQGEPIVAGSDRCVEVTRQQPNDPFLIEIGDRHLCRVLQGHQAGERSLLIGCAECSR